MRNRPDLLIDALFGIARRIPNKYEELLENRTLRRKTLLAVLIPSALLLLLRALTASGLIMPSHWSLPGQHLILYWSAYGLLARKNTPLGLDRAAYLLSAAAVCLFGVQGTACTGLVLCALLTLCAPALLIRALRRDMSDAKYMLVLFLIPALCADNATRGLFYFAEPLGFSLNGYLYAALVLIAVGKHLSRKTKELAWPIAIAAAVLTCTFTRISLEAVNFGLDASAPQRAVAVVESRWKDEDSQYHVRLSCGDRETVIRSDRARTLYSLVQDGEQIGIELHTGALGQEYFMLLPE